MSGTPSGVAQPYLPLAIHQVTQWVERRGPRDTAVSHLAASSSIQKLGSKLLVI